MPSVSNIAVGAAMAGAAATKARHQMNESIARLSTGIRSMYGGDAGGQSVANSVNARGKSFAVASKTAEAGLSFLQSAESVLLELAVLTTRMREIGTQFTNAALLTSTDEAALNSEAAAISAAFTAISTNTKFNGIAVTGNTTVTIAIDDAGNSATVGASKAMTALGTTAATGVTGADATQSDVATALGNVAAGISSLKGYQAVADSTAANLQAAAARIQDTDYALETAALTKASILNQAAMAMVAQANDAQASVLSVIQ